LKSSIPEVKELWKTARKMSTASEIEALLRHDLKKNFPDIFESYFYIE
jgi:hypothetical protein